MISIAILADLPRAAAVVETQRRTGERPVYLVRVARTLPEYPESLTKLLATKDAKGQPRYAEAEIVMAGSRLEVEHSARLTTLPVFPVEIRDAGVEHIDEAKAHLPMASLRGAIALLNDSKRLLFPGSLAVVATRLGSEDRQVMALGLACWYALGSHGDLIEPVPPEFANPKLAEIERRRQQQLEDAWEL